MMSIQTKQIERQLSADWLHLCSRSWPSTLDDAVNNRAGLERREEAGLQEKEEKLNELNLNSSSHKQADSMITSRLAYMS